jgi:kynureninase
VAPLYTRYVDVYEGLARLHTVMHTRSYQAFPAERGRVT